MLNVSSVCTLDLSADLLEAKVQIYMQITGAKIFHQDSAPCHTAKVVKKWFVDNRVELLPNWPSNSPDFNVIENCWNIMMKIVAAHHPTSEVHLKLVLRQVWTTEISPDYCKTLVRSMPSCIAAVLKNSGFPIKY